MCTLDSRTQAAGPMWIGPLHDPDFCEKMLSHVEADEQRYGTSPRIKGMVSTAAEVSRLDHRRASRRR